MGHYVRDTLGTRYVDDDPAPEPAGELERPSYPIDPDAKGRPARALEPTIDAIPENPVSTFTLEREDETGFEPAGEGGELPADAVQTGTPDPNAPDPAPAVEIGALTREDLEPMNLGGLRALAVARLGLSQTKARKLDTPELIEMLVAGAPAEY